MTSLELQSTSDNKQTLKLRLLTEDWITESVTRKEHTQHILPLHVVLLGNILVRGLVDGGLYRFSLTKLLNIFPLELLGSLRIILFGIVKLDSTTNGRISGNCMFG